jgi:carbon storage regulator CsrA
MQEDEVLRIGDNVSILVRRVKGGWVRLCIDAPREIPVLRIPVAPAAEDAEGVARSEVRDVIMRRRPARR